MSKLKFIFIIVLAITCMKCSHRHNNQKANPNGILYEKICATDVPKENLDIPMLASAAYSDGTPFYGKDKTYYELSDKDLINVKHILDNKLGEDNVLQLNINNYFRQYLAYTYLGNIYVLINLYRYYYISYTSSQTKGIFSPAKGLHIITLVNDKNRERYDNVMILLNLTQKCILKVMPI